MPNIERSNVPGLAEPPGGRFCHVVRSGNLVWISGQTARGSDGNIVGKGDAYLQSKEAYRHLQMAIESAGGTMANIVKVTIFLTSEDCIEGSRRAQDEYVQANPPSASSMVIVKALAHPDMLVEIEAFAVLDS